ncbi:replication protein P [Massilia varians]|uniref:replication protein P n=1 Tax=Massilia varians TaxID=457921 RepID=UPI002555017B|nr:replication protein P [Massilia varians]MDK6077922.1 replication protein P [Massilia varians]
MTNVAHIPNLPSSASTRPYSQWFDPVPSLGISCIDHLFNRLDGAYPHKWRSNFANQQAIDNWAESWVEAFEEEGITPEDVKVGLRECRRRFAWPPSCAEFIQACRPSVDPMRAYYEAVAGVQARFTGEHGTWSHPAIYWAAMPMATELQQQTYSQVKARWETALEQQLAKGTWDEIPRPVLALSAPGKSTTGSEKAKAAIKQLVARVTHKPANHDHRGWAKSLLAREAAGEHLLPIQAQFAREALGAPEQPLAGFDTLKATGFEVQA